MQPAATISSLPSQPAKAHRSNLLREKVQLMWILRYVCPKASFNIIRLICAEYMGVCLNLALFTSSKVCLHYASSHSEWMTVFPHDLVCGSASYNISVIYLGGTKVFLCGFRNNGKEAVLMEGGQVDLKTKAQYNHKGAGLVHEPYLDILFLFGGQNSCFCEQYFPKSDKWRNLPSMHNDRSFFNPCLFGELIYLCGGYHRVIETYTPRTNKFEVLKTFIMPPDARYEHTACFVYNKSLIVLFPNYVVRLGTDKWNFKKLGTLLEVSLTSQCAPVIHEGKMFLVNAKASSIIELDLESFLILSKTSDLRI